jgi:hypothetical protein
LKLTPKSATKSYSCSSSSSDKSAIERFDPEQYRLGESASGLTAPFEDEDELG